MSELKPQATIVGMAASLTDLQPTLAGCNTALYESFVPQAVPRARGTTTPGGTNQGDVTPKQKIKARIRAQKLAIKKAEKRVQIAERFYDKQKGLWAKEDDRDAKKKLKKKVQAAKKKLKNTIKKSKESIRKANQNIAKLEERYAAL